MASEHTDFLIVGSGIVGAAVARRLRQLNPSATLALVDGGRPIGSRAGEHLHNASEAAVRRRFHQGAAAGVQSVYVGGNLPTVQHATLADYAAGMHSLRAFRADVEDMPASAIAWNVGGMGVHWTAACPTPFGFEVPSFIPPGEWQAHLLDAHEALQLTTSAFEPSPAGTRVVERLREEFSGVSAPGRGVQAMPMAATRDEGGRILRVGPSRIFPPIAEGGDPGSRLLARTLCTRLLFKGGAVVGAEVVDLARHETRVLEAGTVFICADPLRTPQLLWASGVRSPALGANLNEHAFLSGRVTIALDRIGIGGDDLPSFDGEEPFTNVYWLPHSGALQPFHGQLMETVAPSLADPQQMLYSLGVSVYAPTESIPANRVSFSDDQVDAAGLPRIAIQFRYSDSDKYSIAGAVRTQVRVCQTLGQFDPAVDSVLLAPGSSMHYTGTARMGLHDDGESVCDPDGLVWGFDNLYVAGGGVLPTAMACNTTLAATALAMRSATAASAKREPLPDPGTQAAQRGEGQRCGTGG